MSTPVSPTRSRLMEQHVDARRRRDAAAFGTDEYQQACEEIARIEVAIAAAEEPGVEPTAAPAWATVHV